MLERIQKIIAAAGIMSRRAAEQLILDGRVRLNGQVVTEMGVKADPEKDHIKVDGKLINPKQAPTYVMLNKPAGYVTTMSDPEGRKKVSDLLKGIKVRVYPVGRLDYDTEGLLLLTNDGDFAHLVTHPSHELPKTYLAKIKGVLSDRNIEDLEQGVFLQDGKTAPAQVRKLRKEEANSWVEITIHEGRKRQVRRMIDHTGHSVIKLKRTKVGSLDLGDLTLGTYRHLAADEVQELRAMAQAGESAPAVPSVKPSRRPAVAGHIPEFIEGPKPGRRTAKKDGVRRAVADRSLTERMPGRERFGNRDERRDAFERKSWRTKPFAGQVEGRADRGKKRFDRPSFEGKSSSRPIAGRWDKDQSRSRGGPARSFGSRGQRTDRDFTPREGQKRSFGSRRLQGEGSFAPREGQKRSFGSRRPQGGEGGFAPREGQKRSFSSRRPQGGEGGFAPREGQKRSFGSRRPQGEGGFAPREGQKRSFGSRRPQGGEGGFAPREGQKRSFSSRPARSGERRPFMTKSGGSRFGKIGGRKGPGRRQG